ncbi:MAG: 3-dehydroquinate synthase [Pleurocapsa minor GSE-CHR-MK-17-07R]|jgi:3-dehydroquinate synthase|nr:3-dehydroquinate synthase [Pleurocapsa minor GSE-CHR-MK 17-07R]
MVTLPVNNPEGRYDILIEPGLVRRLAPVAEKLGLTGRVAVVANETVGPLYGETIARALPNATLITIPDGEQYKTLATVEKLYGDFVAAGLDRSSTVIALGGGVTGDTVGFAAASYMRGVRLIQWPTSLLAIVDSSVGAKVGVDLPQGKNLVGAFKQPEHVLIDPTVLPTLPERELRCGMAEAIKHGLIADSGLVEEIIALHSPPHWLDDRMMNSASYFEALAGLLPRMIQVKINVVQEDPYEKGIRAHLNLGHTFAHAIERVSGYAWPHGEAVGVGLIAAALLSLRVGLCSTETIDTVRTALRAVALPMTTRGMDPDAIYQAMATDKKWQAGKSRFVLLKGVGKPVVREGVPADDVLAVLQDLA